MSIKIIDLVFEWLYQYVSMSIKVTGLISEWNYWLVSMPFKVIVLIINILSFKAIDFIFLKSIIGSS